MKMGNGGENGVVIKIIGRNVHDEKYEVAGERRLLA